MKLNFKLVTSSIHHTRAKRGERRPDARTRGADERHQQRQLGWILCKARTAVASPEDAVEYVQFRSVIREMCGSHTRILCQPTFAIPPRRRLLVHRRGTCADASPTSPRATRPSELCQRSTPSCTWTMSFPTWSPPLSPLTRAESKLAVAACRRLSRSQSRNACDAHGSHRLRRSHLRLNRRRRHRRSQRQSHRQSRQRGHQRRLRMRPAAR